MSWVRAVRIGAFATIIPVLFRISQQVSEARGNPPVPGMSYALGVVAVLFFARALATESLGPEANLQKDILWGVFAGAVLAILVRLL